MTELVPARQAGRATIDFYGALGGYANGDLRARAKAAFEDRAATAALPPRDADPRERLAAVQAVAGPLVEWQLDQLLMRVVAEDVMWMNHFASAEAGMVSELGPTAPLPCPVDESLEIPEYYSTVNFHVSPWYTETPRFRSGTVVPNGQKFTDRAGVAAVPKGSDILQQRSDVVAQVTLEDVRRVLDMGTGGSGQLMLRIQQRFPDAELHGVDLSVQFLVGPAQLAAEHGYQWFLSHQNAESTSYPDEHFDLVTSYALLHEVPDAASRNILAEAFRVLRPGGQLLMGDVPPYRQIPDWQLIVSDWETEGRLEPYWREAASLDRGAICRELGFVDVEEYGIGPTDYPWVLRARKPEVAR